MTQAPGGPERTTGNVHMGSERRECLGRGVTHPPGSFQRQAAPRKVEGPLVLPHHRPPAVNLSQGLPFSLGGQWPGHVCPRRRSNWIMDEGEEDNGRTLCARAQGHSVRRPMERDAGRPRQLPSSATEEAPGSQAKRAGNKDRETDVFWGVGRRQRGLGHSGNSRCFKQRPRGPSPEPLGRQGVCRPRVYPGTCVCVKGTLGYIKTRGAETGQNREEGDRGELMKRPAKGGKERHR